MGPDVEVEIKARVDELEDVREQILQRGGQSVARVRQQDTYFDHPVRSFADSDEALRIRRTEQKAKVTYKGPRFDEETKTREEIDVGIEDAERLHEVLIMLGFEPAGQVGKTRDIFELEDLTIALDRVDRLGCFVEIEKVVEGEHETARRSVLALAEELGLTELEHRSYLELLLEGAEGEEQG